MHLSQQNRWFVNYAVKHAASDKNVQQENTNKTTIATLYFAKAIDYLHYYRIFSIIHIFRFMGAMKNYNATSNKRRVCKTKLAFFFF